VDGAQTIVLMSDVGAKLMDDQIDATSASLTFSFLFLLLGVIATVVLSATSKRPFANGFALVMIIQAFLLSFILSAVSAVHIHSAVASDHGSRTLILFVLFFQCAASSNPSPAPFWPPHGCSHPPPGFHRSLGLAFIMSSFTAGVAATVPTDQRIKRLASEPADA